MYSDTTYDMDIGLSILLVNAASLLGAGTALIAIWWQGRGERYALYWALAFLALMLAMPLLGTTRPPFTWVTGTMALAGDILFNLAFLLFLLGSALYAGARAYARRWLAAIGGVAAVTIVALVRGDVVLRELLNAGFLQVAALAILVIFWRHGRAQVADRLLIGCFIIVSALNAFYLADVFINRPADAFDPNTLGNQLIWMAQPFLVTAIAIGGVMAACLRLISQRDAERLAAQALAAQAQAADRAKSEFLATISHEIRTPINAIQGCLQILETHNLNPAQIRLLEVMGGSSDTLLSLINDVLDMAKLEAGRMEMVSGPVDLGLLLGDLMSTMAPKAERKGLDLSLRTGDGVPSGVVTDGKRLRQLLLCLLDNAVKFTTDGSVTLSVARAPAPAGTADANASQPAHWIQFQVADTGVGIAADKLDQIFQAFNQADNSISRRFGGAGLGLAIARSLAEVLGGALSVDSAPGRGSRFTLNLPLVPLSVDKGSNGGTGVGLPAGASGPPIILLVEDDEVNRFVATELLVHRGAQVVQAANGADALSILEHQSVDAVLMDLSMPDMDGLEAARRLRTLPGQAGRVPIVALTANLSPEMRQQCRDAGMQAFLTKPIKLDHLIGTLTAVLPKRAKPAA